MLSFSAKGIYGISAVVELALRHKQGAVQIRDIAEAQGIPRHYLEQILVVLKRGGIVRSFRGSHGGYSLAAVPSEIRLLDVVVLLEGPLEIAPGGRGDPRLTVLWHGLEASILDHLDGSLADLIDRLRDADSRINYQI